MGWLNRVYFITCLGGLPYTQMDAIACPDPRPLATRCDPEISPEISMIIPVLKEPAIAHTLQALGEIIAAAPGVICEVIVVDGEAAGETIARLDPQDWAFPLLLLTARRGRGPQLNAGARRARGRILVFLHADGRLPVGALAKMVAMLPPGLEPGRGAGAFDLAIASSRPILRLIARVASWRSRLTRLPYGDQGIFMRREVFAAIGGFPDIPIMEDVALMRSLKRGGWRVGFVGDRLTVSARRWEREGWLYCTLRNWLLLGLYFVGVAPERLARWYR